MTNYLSIFFKYIGIYGPLILFLYSVFLLWNKSNYLTYYMVGFILNALLTLILKGIFKQPRPSEDPKLFNLAIKESKRFMKERKKQMNLACGIIQPKIHYDKEYDILYLWFGGKNKML